ncbi:MAG TPA: type I 3-dehydroquinate dehydratase [Candidatus Micrarchaeota archaeon]|nr:type I 3-dehydroquinate dehydratase [Candidatus Micrarchaeota archaeon]
MICVSIADCTSRECIAAMKGQDCVEIRLETIKGLDAKAIKEIFSSKAKDIAASKAIATCRPGKMPGSKRKELLLEAIRAGAAYVDIEVEAEDDYKKEIIAAAKKAGCKAIVSYHNYEKTPTREELVETIRWCMETSPEIVKIACKAESPQDNARLLGLLDRREKIAVMGMGKQGRITRVAGHMLGNAITYVALSKGKETAPGQMTKKELEEAVAMLE